MEAVAINGHDTVEFHEETGEIFESPAPLSGLASQGIHKPNFWTGRPTDSIISYIGQEFSEDMLLVQKEVSGIIEQKAKGHKCTYADIGSVASRIIEVLHEKGFTLRQYPGDTHGISGTSKQLFVSVHTRIEHATTGQFEVVKCHMPMKPFSYDEKGPDGKLTGKKIFTDFVDPQSYGAAFTYGKRYSLQGYFAIFPAKAEAVKRLEEEQTVEDIEAAAEPIINGFKSCKSKQELVNWTKANQDMMSMLPVKVFQIVKPEYVEFKKGLPEVSPEDESQENEDIQLIG